MYEGDYVGEIALLFNLKRTATVEAFTLLRMHVLTQKDFDQVVDQYPQDAEILRREMENYFITHKRFTAEQLGAMKQEAALEARDRRAHKKKRKQSAWNNDGNAMIANHAAPVPSSQPAPPIKGPASSSNLNGGVSGQRRRGSVV